MAYEDLTVPELKDLLRERGLPLSGKKADLILGRLSEAEEPQEAESPRRQRSPRKNQRKGSKKTTTTRTRGTSRSGTTYTLPGRSQF